MSKGASKLRPVFKMSCDSLRTWWKHLPKFLMLYVWGILHMAVPAFIFAGLMLGLRSLSLRLLTHVSLWMMSLRVLLVYLAMWAGLFFIYYMIRLFISFFLLIRNEYKGDELRIFQDSRKYFWSYLSLKLILSVIMILLFFALVIPGIIFMVFYSLAMYVFFFEDKRGMSAIRKSRRLVKNHWWATGGRLLFAVAALEIFMFIMIIPLRWLPFASTWAVIWSVISRLALYIVLPAIMIFFYNIYKDLAKIYKAAKEAK